MKIVQGVVVSAALAFAVACGGGSMGTGGGPPPPESVVVSSATEAPFSVAMSTSFQPAEWDYQFFTLNPGATTTLGNLGSHHVRLQGISLGIPQGTQGTASTGWDFSILDAITQPVLGVGDHSPEFQIAKGPAFLYQNNDLNSTFLDQTYAQFAGYAQNLVAYYNVPGGFNASDGNHASPSGMPVTWWGIYNEPNINNDFQGNPGLYVTLYNEVVPKMQTIDPSIKFAALELADFGSEAQNYVPTFVNGVTAHVDAMATHFYSSCNQKDSDAQVFGTIPGFVSDVQFFYSEMGTNPAVFANVPVWVTENNVNADYDKGGGISNCNGGPFVTDQRGSSPFFAAWRPYVFSQLGKAGVQALYHWDFDADKQYGEADYTTAALQLSYWVDYELGQEFPPAAGSHLLQFTGSDDSELETLPVINGDGSVVIMVANHAVAAPSTDNNGPGVSRSVAVDVSALGTFSSGSLVTIDTDTNVSTGPVATAVTPAAQMTINLNGYSVAFLTLKP
jgi:hypothetical protein